MKKLLSLFLLIFVVFALAGCAPDLPDPMSDVNAFYARDIKHIDGEAARQMLDHAMFRALIEGDSELSQLYQHFVVAYLEDIQVSAMADGVELYPRDRSATVRMDVSFVDMPNLKVRAEEMAVIRHDDYMKTGKMPSTRMDNLFLLQSMLEILETGESERISGRQVVKLEYDKTAGWTITNAEELIAAYIW